MCCFSRSWTLPLSWWRALGCATASRQFSASCTDFQFQCSSVSSSRSPHSSTRRYLDTLPDTRLTTAATVTKEDCARPWHSNASRQSDAHQLRRQSLQCSWISRSLELSADGPQTAGFVTPPLHTVAENICSNWSVGPKHIVNRPSHCALEILFLSYLQRMQVDQSIAKRRRLTISHTAIMSHGWWAAIPTCARTTRNVTRPTVGRPLGAIRLRRLAMIAMHVIARVSRGHRSSNCGPLSDRNSVVMPRLTYELYTYVRLSYIRMFKSIH